MAITIRRPHDSASPSSRHRGRIWRATIALEVLAATTAVLLDLIVPTFVLLALTFASLTARREHLTSLGLIRPATGTHLTAKMLAFAGGWSLLQLCVFMPVANHVSGREQDLSDFSSLEGDLGKLVILLALSWTLAAVGEELAYRGYLQTRIAQLFGSRRTGLVVSVLASSILFGIAHTEQGLVGVVIVTIDGIAFSVVRHHYRTLWASVLAHGFNNTIGFIAFFLIGPIHGFW